MKGETMRCIDCDKMVRANGSRGPLPLRCPRHQREHRAQMTTARTRRFRARQRSAAAA